MYDPENPQRRNGRGTENGEPGSDPAHPADEQAAPTQAAQAIHDHRPLPLGGRRGPRKGAPSVTLPASAPHTPEDRLKILDLWHRSGLPAGEFAPMVNLSRHTLFSWQKRFNDHGPAGLMDRERGSLKGSRLPELTKRTILMLKRANPTWGAQRISDMLVRGPALFASANAVARVLRENGFEPDIPATPAHGVEPKRFERARPNQLWQTDLFTFTLKRQNRRVYLVAFLDDHSRFIVSYALHAVAPTSLVIEALAAGIASYQAPEELLTDNGPQFVTWRGKSAFTKELEKRGIRQIVATPKRPQTLGKIERFWGSLWTECAEKAIFLDLDDARRRIGLYIDHYNFQRPHQGIEGLTPADRFFGVAAEMKATLAARVAANALDLARQGIPRKPFYLTGQVGGKSFSLHAEGERVILKPAGGERQEVDLVPPPEPDPASLPEPICPVGKVASELVDEHEEPAAPGASPIDELVPPSDVRSSDEEDVRILSEETFRPLDGDEE